MEILTDDILRAIRPVILQKVTDAYNGKEIKVSPQPPQKEKYPVDFTKNPVCVMVTGYTARSYALFGDFKRRYLPFKNEVMMAKKEIFLASSKLQFGFGWTFKGSDCSKVEKLLKAHNVEYRKISLEDYLKEVKRNFPKDDEEETEVRTKKIMSSEEDERPAKKIMSSTDNSKRSGSKKKTVSSEDEEPTRSSSKIMSTPTKKKRVESSDNEEEERVQKKKIMSSSREASSKKPITKKIMSSEEIVPVKKVVKRKGLPDLTLVQNEWGNNEEKDTSIVFTKLPVGKEGRDILIAVGYQDVEESQENKGTSSLLPLTPDLIAVCEKHEWKYMDEDMIGKIGDKELRKEMRTIMSKAQEEEEDSEAEVEEVSEEEEEEDEE